MTTTERPVLPPLTEGWIRGEAARRLLSGVDPARVVEFLALMVEQLGEAP